MRLQFKTSNQTFGLKCFRLLLAFAVLTVVWGCSGQYGTLKSSPEVTNFFVQNDYKPDYAYYYSGRENVPTAIIDIKPNYQLVPDFWTKIPPNPEALKKLMQRIYQYNHHIPYGYDMLEPSGQKVGILFSKHRRVAIRLEAHNKVQVLIHEPPSGWK